jgi:hypothetical protein
MKLTTKAQAEAFVFFMESEKLRHHKDIRQIDKTVVAVCRAWKLEKPVLDSNTDYWVEVVEDSVPVVQVHQPSRYPANPINADED